LQAGVGRTHGNAAGLLKQRKVLLQLCLLRRIRGAGPQRIQRADVDIRRMLAGHVVEVEVHSLVGIPQVFIDRRAAQGSPTLPVRPWPSKPPRHPRQIQLVFIEQAVQAYGRVVVRRSAERPEAKAWIEA